MFANMKVGVRLGLSFTVIVFMMMLVNGLIIFRSNQMKMTMDDLIHDKYRKTVLLNDIKGEINIIALTLRNLLIVEDSDALKKEVDSINGSREKIASLMDEFSTIVKTETDKELFKKLGDARLAYIESQKKVINLIEARNVGDAKKELLTTVRKAQEYYLYLSDKLIEHNKSNMEKTGNEAKAVANQSRNIVIGALAASVILSFLLATIIIRSITVPVKALLTALQKIAEGDLTVQIGHTSSDEIGMLSNSFRMMINNLRNMISEVSNTSVHVASAANQLNFTAEQIATGAEEVAAQTVTVATASEEMSATSGDIAQNCQMAVESATLASESAITGSRIVSSTIAAMEQISQQVSNTAQTVVVLGSRSDQIGDIVATIEDIADQTNLLALNAAIEAARAGEQGRGFAVVADEVRALAERTTKATREIGEMIKAIQNETKAAVVQMNMGVKEVEQGTANASRSGEALLEILKRINDVTMQINQIATAAEEQTATTSEITNNIHQITEVLQGTASGSHESVKAAGLLNNSAEELQRLVRQFKL
ncbi:MAG: methyl-accepting chemotaxis protein [Desulfuromonadaceae bacterium]|nr:methyl-accepting chemotaxis protein [Desulfuromonadaceae bacterium]MDD2848627.1 methyl-accepting chemotaxis protein [Desulfuromonadaceae bacterium]MDD4130870.1 methyl-accepting chemotaxis protein [Desulfuromonadaceae bacterium]